MPSVHLATPHVANTTSMSDTNRVDKVFRRIFERDFLVTELLEEKEISATDGTPIKKLLTAKNPEG